MTNTGVTAGTYQSSLITVDSAGRVTNAATGSLTGLSDVSSATKTAGNLLVADGTNFKSVAVSGACSLVSDGTLSCTAGTTKLSSITAATTTSTIDSTNNAIEWDWNSLTNQTAMTFGSNSASTASRTLVYVTNSSTASAGTTAFAVAQESNGRAVFIDDNSSGSVALTVDTEATTADGVVITPTVMTTGTALNIGDADGLTTGKIANFASASTSTASRTLVAVTNSTTAAASVTTMAVTHSTTIGTGLSLTADNLTTGTLASLTSSSASTATRVLLQVTNSSTASTGVTALQVEQDSKGASAIGIGTTFTGDAGTAVSVVGNSLTTGSLGSFTSTSASTATRTLYTISSSSTANYAGTLLSLTQNGGATTGVGLTYGGTTGTGI